MPRTSQDILSLFKSTPERERLKVLGAVRIKGSPSVFTLGAGGRPIKSAQDLLTQGFREEEVQEIEAGEARGLGITADLGTLPKTPTAPTQAPTAPVSPLGGAIDQKVEVDPRQDIINSLTKSLQDIAAGIGAQDLGKQFRTEFEKSGLGDVSSRIKTLDVEINKTTDFLSKLSDDITARTQGELVTDPAARRLESVERAPLIEQLESLSRAKGIESDFFQRGKEDILTQLSLKTGERKDILSEITAIINIQKALEDKGTRSKVTEKDGRNVLLDLDTGDVITDLGEIPTEGVDPLDQARIDKIKAEIVKIETTPPSPETPTPESKDAKAKNLLSQGLKPSLMTATGKLGTTASEKIADKDVPPSVIDSIWTDILDGFSLDEIRQSLVEQVKGQVPAGQEQTIAFGYLDTFMQTLQGEGGTDGEIGFGDL